MVPLPTNQYIIDCKWLFKVKYNPYDTGERYKACLVAKEFSQEFGINYFETFGPIAKMVTVRVILSVAAVNHWYVSKMDVNNTFLHGDLNETVFMKLPPGYKVLSSVVIDPTVQQVEKVLIWTQTSSQILVYKAIYCS